MVILIGALAALVASANAQHAVDTAPPQARVSEQLIRLPVNEGSDIRFVRLSRAQGLSQQRVTHIVQDDQGFMWFGTQFGLNRYDGYRFKVFKAEADDPTSLCGVFISALFKDRAGNLWIGCDSSLDRYDPRTESFVHYQIGTNTRTPTSTIRHISEDRQGILWLSTGTGLYGLNPSSRKVIHFSHEPDDPFSIRSDDVKSSGEDREGVFWVATREGLDRLDRRSGKVTLHVPLHEPRELFFYEDRFNVFWIAQASSYGLAVLDRNTQTLTRYSFANRELPGLPLTGVSSILESKDGALWIGTFSDGLLKFDRQHQRVTRYRNEPANIESLSENRITTLLEDREGHVWTGFGATAPAFFASTPPPFKTLPFDSANRANLGETLVNAVFEDSRGTLWMGTTGALNKVDRKSGRSQHYSLPGDGIDCDVLSIAEDRNGKLWVGTSGEGLYEFDTVSGRFVAFRASDSGLGDDTVPRLLVDRAGTLWATTWNGLSRFDPRSRRFTTYRHSSSGRGAPYRSLAEDHSGKLWVGSEGSGLLHFDPMTRSFTAYTHWDEGPTALSDDRVNSVLVDHVGAIWAGTQNGLNRLEPDRSKVTQFTERHGLASNAISCVLEDPYGAIWMGTSNGLSRFDRRTGSFKNYSPADGLPGPDLTGWSACSRSPSGEMFFGGFAGATAFHAHTVDENAYAPPVVLTAFQLAGVPVTLGDDSPLAQAISFTRELTLPYSQNSFSFEFSALSFASPATNRYRYMLEGLDERWREVGSHQRVASYTTLPPGEYRFRVQGATSRGQWSEPGVALDITIGEPWWGLWWMKSIAVLLLIAAIFRAYLYRIRQVAHRFSIRLEERVNERTRIARELHDSLLQGFQGLMFRLQAVRDMLPERAPEAIHALDTAMERGDQAIAEGRAAVQDLRSSMLIDTDLHEALRALAEEVIPPDDAHCNIRVLVEGRPRKIAPLIRDEVYRIAREALSNAVRHAKARNIEAEVEYAGPALHLRVRDDGVGIDQKILERGRRPGHWGLQGMRERALAMGARLEVWSVQGAGTEVVLMIPGDIAYGRLKAGPVSDATASGMS